MITFVISIITLLSGFAFYSRYIESVMKDDLVRPTPATTLNDGVDYVPMP
ncbi:MAG: carbon starvation CstA family protein, partial [Proteiniphilum sp.]